MNNQSEKEIEYDNQIKALLVGSFDGILDLIGRGFLDSPNYQFYKDNLLHALLYFERINEHYESKGNDGMD